MKRGEGLERGKGNEERREVPRLGSRMRSKMENNSSGEILTDDKLYKV